jgi:hypothetical protein
MPLLEHFQPPLSLTHPWKGFHSAWANSIATGLNEVLPEGYYAIAEVPLGDQIEIDVATVSRANPCGGMARGFGGWEGAPDPAALDRKRGEPPPDAGGQLHNRLPLSANRLALRPRLQNLAARRH